MMLKNGEIEIAGKVAEIIESDSGKLIRIYCNNKNMLFDLKHDESVSLGDSIALTGKLVIDSIKVNGINIEFNRD